MIRFHEALKPLLVPADTIAPSEENYNNGDVDLIRESVIVNGCYRPVYVDRTGHIVGGHHLYHALLELGATHIPVLTVDAETYHDKIRIMVGDNEIARKSRPDHASLAELLQELNTSDQGLGGTGQDNYDLLRLLDEQGNDEIPDFGGDPTDTWPAINVRVPIQVHAAWLAVVADFEGDGPKAMAHILGIDE